MIVESILLEWQAAIENQILIVRDHILKHGKRMQKSEIPEHYDMFPELGDLELWHCADADLLV